MAYKSRKLVPPIVRFWRHVKKSRSGCWLWTGAKYPGGYGAMGRGRSHEGIMRAHRFAYTHFLGPIPKGKELDHLCRVRNCVNPTHLEIVTRRENFLRGQHWAAKAFLTDTCKRGHSLLDAYRSHGYRQCRTCTLARYNPQERHNRYLKKKGEK